MKFNYLELKWFVKFIFFIILIFFIAFPSSCIFSSRNELFEMHSDNKEYKLIAYRLLPLSLYSVYKIMSSEGYFFIVYDRCGNVIYKPDLNYGVGSSLIYGEFRFSGVNKFRLIFPTNGGVDSVDLPSVSATCYIE